MHDDLTKNILSTICYYDVLDYPLTIFEIWKYLILAEKRDDDIQKCSIGDILVKLNDAGLKSFIESKNGFYFIRGRDYLVDQRISRGKISALKIKKMRRVIGFLKWVPFVRMILITGRLAMKNASPKSDWDVLVVVKEGRIWTGRTFITLWAHLLGKRRHHDKIRNRLCFNYFITTGSLEIRNKDLFSASEYFFCFPLFEVGNYFQKFQLRNIWIRKYKPNYYLTLTQNLFLEMDSYFSRLIRLVGENLLDHDFVEKYLEKIEKEKIERNPKTQNVESLINADNRALIFLPNPHGPKVFEKFKRKLIEFNF